MPSPKPGRNYKIGVIHGRFQILHHDHLKYLLAGKALCRHLMVGITNPDPLRTKMEASNPERGSIAANPLTYFERYELVRTALEESGIPSSDFSIVPLPINLPELYHYYVPLTAVFFLTIYDDWGRRKLTYFQSLGLKTHILWEVTPDQKGLSASEIRQRMILGERWEHLVPKGVAGLLKQWKIQKRLKGMVKS
jgi:nicotinamide mononucleotide adenylyltransferase